MFHTLYTHWLRRLMSAATWCFQSKVLCLGRHIDRPRSAPPLLPPPPLLIPPPHYHCHYHRHDHYYQQKQYHCQYHPFDSSSYGESPMADSGRPYAQSGGLKNHPRRCCLFVTDVMFLIHKLLQLPEDCRQTNGVNMGARKIVGLQWNKL